MNWNEKRRIIVDDLKGWENEKRNKSKVKEGFN